MSEWIRMRLTYIATAGPGIPLKSNRLRGPTSKQKARSLTIRAKIGSLVAHIRRPVMRACQFVLAPAIFVAVGLVTSDARGSISANFTDGNGAATPDSFQGSGGNGWSSGWGIFG